MTSTVSTNGPAATYQLGQRIGRLLQGREVIELQGDVGSGKTTLIQGMVNGFGFKGEVPSPTFTLSRTYPGRHGLTFYHFDLYRLSQHDIVTDELEEVMGDQQVVVAVEWPASGAAQLPTDRLRIGLQVGESETKREIKLEASGTMAQRLIKGLANDHRA